MSSFVCALLAAFSIWDYPARHDQHDRLRRQFTVAVKEGDIQTMEETCRKGTALLPEDPTWRYNLACSLAYYPTRRKEALDELEKAVNLGFRDADAIANDNDLKRLASERRFAELVEYAGKMRGRPVASGPFAGSPAVGVLGRTVTIGGENLGWNFDFGCFDVRMKMATASAGGNTGDLYMNRDGAHSMLRVTDFPGLTLVRLDEDGRKRRMDMEAPNMLFPFPVFGNASLAYVNGPYWRSIPRSLKTVTRSRLNAMQKFYLSNQTWVFPSHLDTPPVGTNGDVFASIAPYWMISAGRSYYDQYYLRAALTASSSFDGEVKKAIVARGMLAPVIQTLIRKSLVAVASEDDYLTAKAHPTALPPNGVDLKRLAGAAADMTVSSIPPLAPVAVKAQPVDDRPLHPELTYATSFAWAFVLRSEDPVRRFLIKASGAREYSFTCTHGENSRVTITKVSPDTASVTVDRSGMTVNNRIDITVAGRNPGTGWGAPSYVSFAVMDPSAPYSDPALTVASPGKAR